ncbi:MAG: protoporphyrinogen oxidase HemJ [Pseudomonadota bacterium]
MDSFLFLSPWIKALHVISVIAWMAGLFYLPRLYVYHVEEARKNHEMDALFQKMERKLLKIIMNPAMIAAWIFGVLLVLISAAIDWGQIWPWTKLVGILGMTWFHGWCAKHRKAFVAGRGLLSGRRYRMMNEVPTVLMVLIVVSVIVRF